MVAPTAKRPPMAPTMRRREADVRFGRVLALVLGLGAAGCSLNPQPQPPEGFGTADGDASRNGGIDGCAPAHGDGGDAGCPDAALDATADAEGGPEDGGQDAVGE